MSGAKAKCSGKLNGSSVPNSEKYSYATKGYLETYEAEYERGSEYWEYPSALF